MDLVYLGKSVVIIDFLLGLLLHFEGVTLVFWKLALLQIEPLLGSVRIADIRVRGSHLGELPLERHIGMSLRVRVPLVHYT